MHAANHLLLTFLLNVLWLASLLALAGWICSRLLRNAPSRHLYRLWASCLLLSVLLPLVSLARPAEILPSVGSLKVVAAASSTLSSSSLWHAVYARLFHTRLSFGSAYGEWLGALYVLFIFAWLLRFLGSCQKTRRLRRSAYARQLPATIAPIVERCKQVFALQRVPIFCSALARGPITIGTRNPVIIVPEFLFSKASEEQWASMLAHELAHIRRRDFLFNLFQELTSWPLSFHPAVLVMKRQIGAARERACDEMATRAQVIEPATYARALVSIFEMMPGMRTLPEPDYSLGIFDADILEERIMKLLRNNPPSRFWTTTSLLTITAIMLGLCASVSAFSFRVDEGANASSVISFGATDSQPQDALKIGPGITPPKMISKVQPTYPADAKKAKREGIVVVGAVIGTDGKVENVSVLKSVDPSLDESAMNAVRQWTFEPALKDGKPVKVETHVEINFSLKK
ncbi:MAG TPA: M56 family metallopeptidase [Terriglobales bacterium]